MALGNPAVGGSKGDTKTSAKHVVAEMEDLRTGVRFPPPPPIQKSTGSRSITKAAQPPLGGAEAALHVTLGLIQMLRALCRIAGRRYWFPPIRIAQNLK